jgi:hypothetical protein
VPPPQPAGNLWCSKATYQVLPPLFLTSFLRPLFVRVVHTARTQGTRFKSRGRHNRATMPTDTCSRRPSGRPRTMWVVCYPGPPQRSSISSVAPSSAPLLLVRAPPQCVSRACCG